MGSPLDAMNGTNVDRLNLVVSPLQLALSGLWQERLSLGNIPPGRDAVDGGIPLEDRREPRSRSRVLFLLQVPGVDR